MPVVWCIDLANDIPKVLFDEARTIYVRMWLHSIEVVLLLQHLLYLLSKHCSHFLLPCSNRGRVVPCIKCNYK